MLIEWAVIEGKFSEIVNQLKRFLNQKDFDHSRRVAQTAGWLAKRWGADVDRACLAGLAHDLAKGLSDPQLLQEARRFSLNIDDIDEAFPYLLHAKVGACLAPELLNIDDKAVIRAIECHTVGCLGMTLLDRIIYVADVIEPGRSFPGLEKLREMAGKDIEEAFEAAYARSLENVIRTRGLLHPFSVDVWNDIVFRKR